MRPAEIGEVLFLGPVKVDNHKRGEHEKMFYLGSEICSTNGSYRRYVAALSILEVLVIMRVVRPKRKVESARKEQVRPR